MKKLLFVMLLMCSVNILAQDVIVKKDGSTILSKVFEVNTADIKYKKFSNLNGPTYSIGIPDVMSINYENGEKDTFDSHQATSTSTVSQGLITKAADLRNAEIISMYNRRYEPTDKIGKSKKVAKRILIIVGMKSTSLVSNEDVEMQMITKKMKGPYYDYWCQALNIVNKTDNTIYIDKGNCFRISSDTKLYCYYDSSEQTTVNSGRGGGASIGLGSVAGALGIGGIAGQIAGGVNIGGGTSSSVSTTYSQQRIIAVPGNTSRLLTDDKWVAIDRTILLNEQELLESMERFQFKYVSTSNIGIREGSINIGEVKTFGENDLPWNRRYIITYSTDPKFTTYSSLSAEFYIQEVIGVPRLMSPMNYRPTLGGLMEDELKFDTFVHDFNEYTIIGYHQFSKD